MGSQYLGLNFFRGFTGGSFCYSLKIRGFPGTHGTHANAGPENSMVAFLVNPPEGTEHGPKLIEPKIQHHIYFKSFQKVATFMLGWKKNLNQN